MEGVQGGSWSNADKAACTIGTIATALGAVTVATGLGLALWGIGMLGAVYCNYRMIS